jgi:hypothetical protein
MSKLYGRRIKIAADTYCCVGNARIETGGPEHFNLICTSCGRRCGQLDRTAEKFLLRIYNTIGAPAEIILRSGRFTAFPGDGEQPPAEPAIT